MKKIIYTSLLSFVISSTAVHAVGINDNAAFNETLKQLDEILLEEGEILVQELEYEDDLELKNEIETNSNFELQESDNDDLTLYGYDNEEAVDAIGIEIEVFAPTMREARIASIDNAIKHAVTEFAESYALGRDNNAIDKVIANHVDRVLIIDEHYDKETRVYTGYFDVWLDKFNSEKIFLGFNPVEDIVDNSLIPNWVLIVPALVTNDGFWTLADKNSSWSNMWNLPKSTETTQFIGVRSDAEDQKASTNMHSLADFTVYLANKYRADNIMFVAASNGTLNSIYWSNGKSFLSHASTFQDLSENENKEQIVDLFWEIFNAETKIEQDVEETDIEPQNLYKYRIVGTPKINDENISVNLQVIFEGKDIFDFEQNLLMSPNVSYTRKNRYEGYAIYNLNIAKTQQTDQIEEILRSLSLVKY